MEVEKHERLVHGNAVSYFKESSCEGNMGLQMFGTREKDRNLDGIRLPCKMEVIDSFGHYSYPTFFSLWTYFPNNLFFCKPYFENLFKQKHYQPHKNIFEVAWNWWLRAVVMILSIREKSLLWFESTLFGLVSRKMLFPDPGCMGKIARAHEPHRISCTPKYQTTSLTHGFMS